jgi:hypothetical protein
MAVCGWPFEEVFFRYRCERSERTAKNRWYPCAGFRNRISTADYADSWLRRKCQSPSFMAPASRNQPRLFENRFNPVVTPVTDNLLSVNKVAASSPCEGGGSASILICSSTASCRYWFLSTVRTVLNDNVSIVRGLPVWNLSTRADG